MLINHTSRSICALSFFFLAATVVGIEPRTEVAGDNPMSAEEMREWLRGFRQHVTQTVQETWSRAELLQSLSAGIRERIARWDSESFGQVLEELLEDTEAGEALREGLTSFLWSSPGGGDILPNDDRRRLRELLWRRIRDWDKDLNFYRLFGLACLDEEVEDFLELIVHERDDQQADRMLNTFLRSRRLFVYGMVEDAIERRAARFPDRSAFHEEWEAKIAEQRAYWYRRTLRDKIMFEKDIDSDEQEHWRDILIEAYLKYRETNPPPLEWANAIVGIPGIVRADFRPHLIKWLTEEHPTRNRLVEEEILRQLRLTDNPDDVPLLREYLLTLPIEEVRNASPVFTMLARYGDESDYELLLERHHAIREYVKERDAFWNHVRGNERLLEEMRERLGIDKE